MTKNQWSGMIIVVVVLSLAVGFMGGSLYEKRVAQSVEVVHDDKMKGMLRQCSAALAQCLYEKGNPQTSLNGVDEMQVWLRKCRALRAGRDPSRCVITGKIE